MRVNFPAWGLIVLFLAAGILPLSGSPSQAAERAKLALIIANENYADKVGPLKNSHQNAALIEGALKKLGFKITLIKDADFRAMDLGIKRFAYEVRRAGKDAVSFIYYSGHGLANPQSRADYLVPLSVPDTDDETLWRHSLPLLTALYELTRGAPEAIHYVAVDAARKELKLPNEAKGLAPIVEFPNMLVSFATAPMATAQDSGTEPGAYARALAEEIIKPDVEASAMFQAVQARVKQASGQTPWLSSSRLPTVYFSESASHQQAQEKAMAEAGKPAAADEHKVGESFRDCANCPEMVVVPAGSFMMGSPENEPERSISEGPQHKVTFAKPFAVGKYAVTFDEWDACVADAGCGGYRPSDEGWGRGDRPVVNVGWDDAQSYVKWLSKKTGKKYRLLSEAEWEYMARAGTTTPFWWGASITPAQANYDGQGVLYKGGGSYGEYRKKTLPVKSFEPNPWGIYQVHGNVWEWVEDCWNNNYAGAPADGSPRTTGNCGSYVVRGGAWTMGPRDLRSANRIFYGAKDRNEDIGFRVARSLD